MRSNSIFCWFEGHSLPSENGGLDSPIAIPQKPTKTLTTKLIEVEPYKWIQIIDGAKDKLNKNCSNPLSGALTKNRGM